MIAPFLGCLFGGFLYDVFIYTGPSPINTPYMGLGKLFRPKKAIRERLEVQKKEGLV
jgi:aquaglyceroporin related protein